MEKDKTIEALFLAQKPHFDDSADFMAALNKRLDAVEYVRQHQEATIRRYRMAMVAAFVVGILVGGFAVGYLLAAPINTPLFTFTEQKGFWLWLSENSRLIATTILSLLMTVGIVSIFTNIQDIKRMRVKLKV
ncbi:MAG: hypothetical protein K6E52_08290 [Bacteroidaceae bacterium]|nr:hypothetical protein [Bacteroidaceae bacterium]